MRDSTAPAGRSEAAACALDAAAAERLARNARRARELARRDGAAAYAAVTVAIDPGLDPAGALLAARCGGEPLSCFEQPDRNGYAVCGLGAVARLRGAGPARFAAVAREARALTGRLFGDDPAADAHAPAGSGPCFAGGFAFDHHGGGAPEWSGFAAAQLVLPELSIARGDGHARLTVTVAVEADDDADELAARAGGRAANIRAAPMPLVDPDPLERPRVAGAAPPSHFEEAVRRAAERIRAGGLEKVVLAREVRVHAAADLEAAPVYAALRAAFPACYCYLAAAGGGAFVGASPELLVRRDGARAQTVALAGTTRRSADPATDDHLGEQLMRSSKNREEHAIVARRIERTLAPVSVWVAAALEPAIIKVQNVQHLATPVRAQLAEPVSCVELAGILHPTPAVGGEPRAAALPLIPALEGLDRGWYAGAVGWTDASEDGELCVALRCALLRGPMAHLYAGCGIVADSVPAEELAETEVKLAALLPLLAG